MSAEVAAARPDLSRACGRHARLVAAGRGPGAQLAVRWRGEEVYATAAGIARGFRAEEGIAPAPVAVDIPFAVFSAGKPVVATAIAILEARRHIDLAAPVAAVMPESAGGGKASITVLDVLTHRSGVLLPASSQQPEDLRERARVRAALAGAVPVHWTGTLAYGPLEYGWILGEVVERVSGYAIGRDFERVNNSVDVLEADLPGAGLVTDACSLAAFYELWPGRGTMPSGVTLLPEARADRYLARHVLGLDRSNRVPLAWPVDSCSARHGRRPTAGAGRAAASGMRAPSRRSRSRPPIGAWPWRS